MGFMRDVFGPSKDEVWKQLCTEIGADFVERGVWRGNMVQAHVGQWTVTLDTFTVSNGKTSVTYTRMRAPYVNPDGFRFKIYRRGLFSDIGKLLGMQDVEVGYPAFDDSFIIKGSDEMRLRSLFMNTRLRELLEAQSAIYLEVKDDEGWFGSAFPDGVDELYFQVTGIIKDIDRLKGLFELFAETLNDLCRIGSAYETDPGVNLA